MISTTKNKAEEGRWIELGKGSQLHRMFRVGRWVAITFAIGTKTYGRNQNECGYCGYLKLCAMVEKNASEYFFMHLAFSSFPGPTYFGLFLELLSWFWSNYFIHLDLRFSYGTFRYWNGLEISALYVSILPDLEVLMAEGCTGLLVAFSFYA